MHLRTKIEISLSVGVKFSGEKKKKFVVNKVSVALTVLFSAA